MASYKKPKEIVRRLKAVISPKALTPKPGWELEEFQPIKDPLAHYTQEMRERNRGILNRSIAALSKRQETYRRRETKRLDKAIEDAFSAAKSLALGGTHDWLGGTVEERDATLRAANRLGHASKFKPVTFIRTGPNMVMMVFPDGTTAITTIGAVRLWLKKLEDVEMLLPTSLDPIL
jgi:hypothetical protein